MRFRLFFAFTWISFLIGISVAGCGGSGDSPSSATSGRLPSPSHSGTIVNVTATANVFSVNQITVKAGKEVSILFTNTDAAPHNIAIYTNEDALEELFVGETFTGPDKTVEYYFIAPEKPANYFFRDDVHPTTMTGQFKVN
jgi:plastocyanin